ncbi:MAG: biopolymer transporter ExbD [Lentisphaerae bacterium]|nr:biopolymer transporter ExbD [Lentisphaerota bacterium]
MRMPDIPEDASTFNMSPMIDMVFQLMIFFMVASHFSTTQNVDLKIPSAVHAVVPRDRPDRVVVNIREDGALFCGEQAVANVDDLKAAVKSYKDLSPGLKVYLRADRDAEHMHVRKVMNAMGELGIDDFIFGAFKLGEGQSE